MNRRHKHSLSHFLGLAVGLFCNLGVTFREIRDKVLAYRLAFVPRRFFYLSAVSDDKKPKDG